MAIYRVEAQVVNRLHGPAVLVRIASAVRPG